MPAFFGVAWHDNMRNRSVCLPVPLNIIAGVARDAYYWLRFGWKAVPVNPRAAYAAGLRDAKKLKAD